MDDDVVRDELRYAEEEIKELKKKNEKLKKQIDKNEFMIESKNRQIDRWIPCSGHIGHEEKGKCSICELNRWRDRATQAEEKLKELETPTIKTTHLQEVYSGDRFKLYREENGAGGHRYWSDSIGGGVIVWDTCLSSEEELMTAMKCEKERKEKENEQVA